MVALPVNWCILYYYSFKIFSRFWLVKTTHIVHHNQLLFTKFAKNLRHIESMTTKVQPAADYSTVDVKMMSKVQPAADYWTDDVKMTSKVQPAVDYWTVDRKTWGWGCVIFGWQKNKELIFSLRVPKYFEWILQIAERVIHLGLRPRWITPSLICKILHNLRKLNSVIGNYFFLQRGREVNKRPRSSMKHRSVREEGERRKFING